VSYTEALAAYEAGEVDAMSALELAGCHSLIELYEGAADEKEAAMIKKTVGLFLNAA
jgi:hypothetical protein